MSFFRSLFGGGGKAAEQKPLAEETYKDCHITATPSENNGHFQIAGLIVKEIDGERREHKLLRADYFPDKAQAAEATIRKAKQAIDQLGDTLFR
ncbi:MAG: transcriptional regulator [Hyphomicrobiales bacterium]|nr:MAG: transcriptional regulator [Hyphomicrobiales bacterium]